MAIGPTGPSLCAHLFSDGGAACGCSRSAALSRERACVTIHSACRDSRGSRGRPRSQYSRACRKSPLASRALASVARRSSCSECTRAWHLSQTSVPGASSFAHRRQFRISSGVFVDTAVKEPRQNLSTLTRLGSVDKRTINCQRSARSHPPGNFYSYEQNKCADCPTEARAALPEFNERRR